MWAGGAIDWSSDGKGCSMRWWDGMYGQMDGGFGNNSFAADF